MIIILLGPPGVGKGTQAKLLAAKCYLTILSTGEILRKAITERLNLGLKVQETINNGCLISDDIVCSLVENKLIDNRHSKGFILDGFPRTINQAKRLELFCVKNDIDNPYIIVLDMQEKKILKRLSARISCSKCNLGYNLITNPMKVHGVCDQCKNKEFYTREDDKEESIKKRLIEYNNQTKPLIRYYNDDNRYFYLEADMSIENINQRLISLLN